MAPKQQQAKRARSAASAKKNTPNAASASGNPNRNRSSSTKQRHKHKMERLILLTGPPGVGKTTLLRKIGTEFLCGGAAGTNEGDAAASSSNKTTASRPTTTLHRPCVGGMYSAECRDAAGQRSGFAMISLTDDADRCTLASCSGTAADLNGVGGAVEPMQVPRGSGMKMFPRLGKYRVHLQEFEDFAMRHFADFKCKQGEGRGRVFFLDEIGKMELFSERFVAEVRQLLADESAIVVATVAQKGDGFLAEVRERPGAKLVSLVKANREKTAPVVQQEIVQHLREKLAEQMVAAGSRGAAVEVAAVAKNPNVAGSDDPVRTKKPKTKRWAANKAKDEQQAHS